MKAMNSLTMLLGVFFLTFFSIDMFSMKFGNTKRLQELVAEYTGCPDMNSIDPEILDLPMLQDLLANTKEEDMQDKKLLQDLIGQREKKLIIIREKLEEKR